MRAGLAACLLRIAALCGAAGLSPAALAQDDQVACGSECEAAIERLVQQDEKALFPQLYLPIERFDRSDVETQCTARGSDPTVQAIVIAPLYDSFPLPGTQNDAKLLKSLFSARGLASDDIHILDGNGVTRERMIGAMQAVVNCVRERDQVILTFSGIATAYKKWRARDYEEIRDDLGCDRSEAKGDADIALLCQLPETDEVVEAYERVVENRDEHVLAASDSIIADADSGVLVDGDVVHGVGSSDLSNFATQIRNRGGDVVFVLDSNYAEDFRLLQMQQAAAFDTAWVWTRGFDLVPTEKREDVVELYGSGGMAALYAARADEIAFESPRTGDLLLGELTFAISEALHNLQNPTILQLAGEIDRTMAENDVEQVPVFEATNPQMRFLATRAQVEANSDAIAVIEPALTRGALAPATATARIVARYEGNAAPAFATIDGVNIEVASDGRFEREVELGARTELALRVYGRDASLLSERRLLFGENATEAQLPAVARRVALIVANDAYNDPAYPALATPLADGQAVAELLVEKFGYATKLDMGDGKQRDLFLHNATKADIQKVLFDLRKRLTADDQLIVYYAGHGEVDDEETAYWVPVDGERGMDVTWIRAFDITDEMRRINAGSMLVISDSCYAGGLSRSAVAIKAEDDQRDSYLARAARFRARQLISSGGVQPVEDGGGAGHSLFARALIDSLGEMPEKVFTASELFEGKLKPRALALAAAQRSPQIPGYFRIAPAGDEPTSEFIFRQN